MQHIFFTTILQIRNVMKIMTYNKKKEHIPHFTESVFYELKQTARVMKIHAAQLFDSLNILLTPADYIALDTIMCNPNVCQRDLAKMLVIDRANTGRILNTLEEHKFIVRNVDTKNNRLVKKCVITHNGIEELNRVNSLILSHYTEIEKRISKEEIEAVRLSLKKLRTSIEQYVENKI